MKIRRHKSGPRVYLLGFRIHHGTVGIIGTIISLALIVHDYKDFPFTDSSNH